MRKASLGAVRFKDIRFLVCDVDGVLTKGDIILDGRGGECKQFSAQDGLGLVMARLGGLQTAFLSGRQSRVVDLRAKTCGVELVMQGRKQKVPAFKELCRRAGIPHTAAAYMGDDLPDLPVCEYAGLFIAVKNAVREVKQAAHYITRAAGGQGAVREVVERILRAQGTWSQVKAKVLGRHNATD